MLIRIEKSIAATEIHRSLGCWHRQMTQAVQPSSRPQGWVGVSPHRDMLACRGGRSSGVNSTIAAMIIVTGIAPMPSPAPAIPLPLPLTLPLMPTMLLTLLLTPTPLLTLLVTLTLTHVLVTAQLHTSFSASIALITWKEPGSNRDPT